MRNHVEGNPRPRGNLDAVLVLLGSFNHLADVIVGKILLAEVGGEHVGQREFHQNLVLFHTFAHLEPSVIPAPFTEVVIEHQLWIHPASRAAFNPPFQALKLDHGCGSSCGVLKELFMKAVWVMVKPPHWTPLLEVRRHQAHFLANPQQQVADAVGEQNPKHVVTEDGQVLLELRGCFLLEHKFVLLPFTLFIGGLGYVPVIMNRNRPATDATVTRCVRSALFGWRKWSFSLHDTFRR
mmetsp:Transcript_36639/g.85877  ORF Transcript_36639/g.85877 Transcript_36639/m.85877 type:complete len:238 (+) Transcript_36639:1463-2176(+)